MITTITTISTTVMITGTIMAMTTGTATHTAMNITKG